jgi:hypothetical protein
VVNLRVQSHGEETRVERRNQYCTVLDQNTWWQSSSVSQLDLERNEDADQKSETEKTSPNLAVAPRICGTSPLQSKQKTDDGTDQEEGTQEIDLLDLFLGSHVGVSSLRVLKEEKHCYQSYAAEGEIDPEALQGS